jgi:hypothetical protein
MEISKSISFITEDPRWQQKLLTGTGVLVAATVLSPILIGLIGFVIAVGYSVRLMQNVRDGDPMPLPEWDQWGEDLARGFKLTVVTLVWIAPLLILAIPSGIGSALAGSRSDAAVTMGVMLSICGGCLSFLYSLFVFVMMPGFSIAFAEDERINSGLQFRKIWDWTRANSGQVVVVTLIYIAASIALSLLGAVIGVLLCIIGLLVTVPLASLLIYLIQYHLYGQLAYSFPMSGGSQTTPEPPVYTPPADMNPGVMPEAYTPTVPPVDTAATTDYPESGIDNPPPTPPAA